MRIAPRLVALVVLAVLSTAAPVGAAGPGLTASQPGVAAGEVITFAAEGFARGERIALWATAPDGAVFGGDDVSADERGRARASFRVPDGALGGVWAMTAFGLTSRAQAIAQFEVAGRPAGRAEPLAWAAPESGPPGSTFQFAATGFERRERVSYWFTAPDGSVYASFSQTLSADTAGRADISWASPPDAPRGQWVVTLQGVKSGVARAVSFKIQ
jgi:hypothetical protein